MIIVHKKTTDHILFAGSFYCWPFEYFGFDFFVEEMDLFGGWLDFPLTDWDCLLRKQRSADLLVSKDHAKVCGEILYMFGIVLWSERTS